MKPNGSTSPVPSVSTATVDSRNLPSRGKSLQNDAKDGRSRAGEVTRPSMTKTTDSPQTGFGPRNGLGASRPGGRQNCVAVTDSLVVSATCATVLSPLLVGAVDPRARGVLCL